MLPRNLRIPTVLAGVLAAAAIVLGGLRPALAEDFRVDNQVFSDKATAPESQGITIFQGGVVYDFLDNPPEVVVFDPAARRFVLLDAGRRLTAEVSIEKVTTFNDWQKAWATNQPNRVLQFFGQPRFEESFSKAAGELTLSSPWAIYKIKLAAAGKGVAEQYREFCDWYARLNAVLSPRSRPPFARLAVNEAVIRHGAIPRQIELTLVAKNGAVSHQTVIRSQHKLVEPLAKADLERIAAVQRDIKAFKPISFGQYCKREQGPGAGDEGPGVADKGTEARE
jgi:hypothetical protein